MMGEREEREMILSELAQARADESKAVANLSEWGMTDRQYRDRSHLVDEHRGRIERAIADFKAGPRACTSCAALLGDDPEMRTCAECGAMIPSWNLSPQSGDAKPVGDSDVTWGELFGRPREGA